MNDQEEMGQLALVFGDFHIPMRSADIPANYKEMITPNKVNTVFCTGNVGCRQIHDWAKSLSSTVHFVKGDYEDEALQDLPEEKVIEFGDCKIGLLHGHQMIPWDNEEGLYKKAKQMGVTLLIYGHTHALKVSTYKDCHFLNPGSMTGAYSSINKVAAPTFMILEFKAEEIIIYEYSLADGEVKCVDTKIPKHPK